MRCTLCNEEKRVEKLDLRVGSVALCAECRKKWEMGRISPEELLEALCILQQRQIDTMRKALEAICNWAERNPNWNYAHWLHLVAKTGLVASDEYAKVAEGRETAR